MEETKINKEFYSVLVRCCLTILAITSAFYGGLVVYLGQQAKDYRREVVASLQQVDVAIQSFSDLTEPVFRAEWSIPMMREINARNIMEPESWNSSPMSMFNPMVENVVENCTQAYEWDQEIIDWLEMLNISHFLAHYNLAKFSLHHLVSTIYQEFPPPPGMYSIWEVENFIRSDFPNCKEDFLTWATRYSAYYSGVSQIRSEMSSALQNISEAHIDAAKLSSQQLEEAIKENETDMWYIDTLEEEIEYYTDLSMYYKTVFRKLEDIKNEVNIATNMIHTHDEFLDLAFSNIQVPISIMTITGVIVPMIILGLDEYIDKRGSRWIFFRRFVTGTCIILFGVSALWIIDVIWQQFNTLYLV